MKVQAAKRIIVLQEWAAQINARNQSGQTVKQWCNEHGINIKTYYNRVKIVREEMLELLETGNTNKISNFAVPRTDNVGIFTDLGDRYNNKLYEQSEKPVFAALPIPQSKSSAAVTVRIGEYAVDIQNSADDAIIAQVLRLVAQL